MQSLRVLLREVALGDSLLVALIVDRFYPSEIAFIANPVYPCVNFSIDVASGADRDIPKIHSINFGIWAWDKTSIDQAYAVYEAVFNIFERQLLTSSAAYALLFQISSPFNLYDPVTQAYGWFGRWNAHVTQRT